MADMLRTRRAEAGRRAFSDSRPRGPHPVRFSLFPAVVQVLPWRHGLERGCSRAAEHFVFDVGQPHAHGGDVIAVVALLLPPV